MGFDSNGNWSSDFYPIADRDNSVPILASKFQTLIQSNLKQSFENCILRDGTGKPTANINWNGNKITNLADGTNQSDAVNKGQLDNGLAVSAGEGQQGTIEIATNAEALAGTNDTKAMTPAKVKYVVDNLATNTRFAVNGGYATNGAPDLLGGTSTATLYFKVDDGTSYRSLVATTASGSSFKLESVNTYDVSALTDGSYNVFVDSTGASYLYANAVYRQPNQPISMNTNDIWFNTCEPYSAYIKTVSDLIECNLVQLPQIVKVESNVISSIDTVEFFNDNGSRIFRKLRESYINGGSWYKVFDEYNPLNGFFVGRWCEQGGESSPATQIVLLKAFNDANYTITGCPNGGTVSNSASYMAFYNKTATGFYVTTSENRYSVSWEAKGYII